MLTTFLSLPVAAPQNDRAEAYQLAWRPAGAQRLELSKQGQLKDEPLTVPLSR